MTKSNPAIIRCAKLSRKLMFRHLHPTRLHGFHFTPTKLHPRYEGLCVNISVCKGNPATLRCPLLEYRLLEAKALGSEISTPLSYHCEPRLMSRKSFTKIQHGLHGLWQCYNISDHAVQHPGYFLLCAVIAVPVIYILINEFLRLSIRIPRFQEHQSRILSAKGRRSHKAQWYSSTHGPGPWVSLPKRPATRAECANQA